MGHERQGLGASVAEVEKNRTLLKQARGPGLLQLTAASLIESGVVVLLLAMYYWFHQWFGGARSEASPPWFVGSLVIFALGAQAHRDMLVNKRIDSLVSLLIRKRMLDDEVAETRLHLDAGGSAPGDSVA
jgi:hypothetical protein